MNWRRFFQREHRDDDFARELDSYIAHEIDDNLARGMNRDEAQRAARRKFGNPTLVKEDVHRMNSLPWIETIFGNLRYGLRQLRLSPGFTAAALLSLALGIGANTAIFQLLDAVRLRSLPVQRPSELVKIKLDGGEQFGTHPMWTSEMTYALWEQIREHQRAFTGVFAWTSENMPFEDGPQSRQVEGLWASGETFQVLGVIPHRGRMFQPADDQRSCADPPAVISYAFWQSQYGGDDAVIGSQLRIAGRPFTIIGVTPPEFYGLEVGKQFSIALPTCAHEPWGRFLSRKEVFWLIVMGRLKPDWTLDRASAHIESIRPAALEAAAPDGYDVAALKRWSTFKFSIARAPGGLSRLRNDYEQALWLLLGVTGMVLLIACANLANLLLARAAVRRREIAVRLALGASRARLTAQLLSESLLLAVAGAAAGAILARFLSSTLVSFLSTTGEPFALDLRFDWTVLAFTAAVATLTCLICGLAPAIRSTGLAAAEAMKAGARTSTSDRRSFSFQRLLVVAQVAISLALVVGALLFVRSFHYLITMDPGFERNGLLFADLSFGNQRLDDGPMRARKRELLETIRAIPGVEAASTTSHIPLHGMSWVLGLRVPGHEGDGRDWSQFTWVSPEYFATMRVPIRKGRDFNQYDTRESAKVALVNEMFVRQRFDGADPVGKLIHSLAEPGFPAATYQIVGIVADTRYDDLRKEVPPIAYLPETQNPISGPFMMAVVRTSLPPAQAIEAIRKNAEAVSPGLRSRFTVLRAMVDERLVRERTLAWLSGFFGALAALVAMLGIYGVFSYMVARRGNEIGIRIALGSSRAAVVWLVLRQMLALLAIGAALGGAIALAAARGASTLLYGLQPNDPFTLVLALAVLTGVALLATLLPARRAARLDPMRALREE